MANNSHHHGVKIIELTGGTRYLQTFRTSVIDMVGTALDVDDDVFPENVLTFITYIQDGTGNRWGQPFWACHSNGPR